MSNADTVLTVGTFDCNDGTNTSLLALELGVPNRSAQVFSGPQFDLARTGMSDTSELVETSFTVLIADSSVDEVGDRIAALTAELRDLAEITVGLKGAENTGTLRPRIASCAEMRTNAPYDTVLVNKYTALVDVTVMREPWVYAVDDSLYASSSVTLPADVSLATMTGTAPAALDVTLTSAALYEYTRCHIGYTPDTSMSITDFIYLAEDLTWTSGTSISADTAGWYLGMTSNLRGTTSASGKSATIDTSAFEPGEYLVLARGKTSNASGTVYVGQQYGSPVELTSTSLDLYNLGVVHLPTADVYPPGEAANLTVTITGDGTYYAWVNAFAFVPVSFGGYLGWSAPAGESETYLRFIDGVFYRNKLADAAGLSGSRSIRALGGQLIVIAEKSTPVAQLFARLSVSYEPRWETFIP